MLQIRCKYYAGTVAYLLKDDIFKGRHKITSCCSNIVFATYCFCLYLFFVLCEHVLYKGRSHFFRYKYTFALMHYN